MTKSKKIFVGRYAMNKGTMLLYLDPTTGDGSALFDWVEGTGYCCIVTVGALDKLWAQMVRKLVHELVEISAVAAKVHFQPSGILTPVPADSYLMVMTHPQFTQVVDEAGDALAYALPDMEKAWKKWKKETK